MEDNKHDDTAHVEMDAGTLAKAGLSGMTEEAREIQRALRDYVPDTDAEKKLLRKIDLRLMPILWLMYVLNYVDRTNIVCCPSAPNHC